MAWQIEDIGGQRARIVTEMGAVVGIVYTQGGNLTNGHLACAAPDMLAALELIRDSCSHNLDENGNPTSYEFGNIAHQDMLAAIAKATGKAVR